MWCCATFCCPGVMTRLGGQEGLQKLEKDGFLDIKDGAGNVEYRVTKESLEDRLSTDMNAACLAIPKECHVLTIHGAKDEVVPVEDAYKFSQKISTHSLSILDNANHGYRSHQHDLAQCVLDFVKDGWRIPLLFYEVLQLFCYWRFLFHNCGSGIGCTF